MTVSMQSRLNHRCIREGEPATVYLLVQISASAAQAGARQPLNISAVIDRSGSMAGPKLAYTKTAIRFLVDQMEGDDYLSLVAFDDQVSLLFPAGHVVQKDALKAHVAGLCEGGSTNLSGGMITGYREVRRHLAKERLNRVLLLTDGQANVGVTDPALLVQKVKELREQSIQLSALGLGADFNEDLLTAMAEAGGGEFHFIENPDQIPAIFAAELQGLLATAAQGVQLIFRAGHGVSVTRVVGYPPAGKPERVELSLPDLYSNEVKSLVLELAVEPGFAGERPLGALFLACTESDTGAELSIRHDLTATVTGDSALLSAPADEEVMKQLYLARSGEALEQAVERADRLEFSEGSLTLCEVAEPMARLAMETGDAQLQARAEELQRRAAELRDQVYDKVTRKQMKAQSFQSRRGR